METSKKNNFYSSISSIVENHQLRKIEPEMLSSRREKRTGQKAEKDTNKKDSLRIQGESLLQIESKCYHLQDSKKGDYIKELSVLQEEDDQLKNLGRDTFLNRQQIILRRKKISNHRLLISQTKEMLKLIKLLLILQDKKQTRGKINQLDHYCRKLRILNRTYAQTQAQTFHKNFDYFPNHAQNKLTKSKSKNSIRKSTGRRLVQSSKLLEKKHNESKSFGCLDFSIYQQQRKKYLQLHCKMLRSQVSKTKEYFHDRISFLKLENELINGELDLTKSESEKNKVNSKIFRQKQNIQNQTENLFYNPKQGKRKVRKEIPDNESRKMIKVLSPAKKLYLPIFQ